MNCLKCDQQAWYYCSCSDVFICKYHMGDHLLSTGIHNYECLPSLKYSKEKLKFQQKLKSQISSLKTLKTLILSQSLLFQSSINSLISSLSTQIKSFSDLLILERSFLPESEEKNVLFESVFESKLEINTKHFESIMKNLENLFKIELFHIKMRVIDSQKGLFSNKFLETHNSGFLCLAVSPDEKILLTGSQDTSFRIWDLGLKKQVACLLRHKGQVKCLAISNDSALAATGSFDRSVILWDVRKKDFKFCFDGHSKAVFSVAFSFDCQYVVSGSLAFEIIIWNTRSFNSVGKIATKESVRCGLTTYNNFYVAGIGRYLEIWDLSSFTNLISIQAHEKEILCMTSTVDGFYAITGSSDCKIRIWNMQYQSNHSTLVGHRDEVLSLAMNSDNNMLVSGSNDQVIIIWSIESKSIISSINIHNDHINGLAISSDILISVSRDSKIGFYQLSSGKLELFLTTKPFYLQSYFMRNNVVSFGSSKDVIVWNLTQNQEIVLKGHVDEVQATCISFKHKYLLSTSRGTEKNVIFWNLEQFSMISVFTGHQGSVFCVDISDDELHAISGDYKNSIRLWFLRTNQQVFEFKGHSGPVYSVKFTSNKKLAASAGLDKKVIVWDVLNKVMHACFDRGISTIWKVFITNDDRFVVSADRFNGISVFSLEKKRLESIYDNKIQAKDWLERYPELMGELSFYLF